MSHKIKKKYADQVSSKLPRGKRMPRVTNPPRAGKARENYLANGGKPEFSM